MRSLLNWLYDWWNARKLEDMRVGCAYMHLCLKGETKGTDLAASVRRFPFGNRMTSPQWSRVVHRLLDEQGVVFDERWVQEQPHLRAFSRFYRVPGFPGVPDRVESAVAP